MQLAATPRRKPTPRRCARTHYRRRLPLPKETGSSAKSTFSAKTAMSYVSSLPKRPDAATPAHMRGIRCYEPRMRLLFGIESAALAHAADGRRVLDPLNLAWQVAPRGTEVVVKGSVRTNRWTVHTPGTTGLQPPARPLVPYLMSHDARVFCSTPQTPNTPLFQSPAWGTRKQTKSCSF